MIVKIVPKEMCFMIKLSDKQAYEYPGGCTHQS